MIHRIFIALCIATLVSCNNSEPAELTTSAEKEVETYNGIPISEKEPENYTGEYQEIYKNGLPKMKGLKISGKREGRWQSWHPTGAPASECDYKNGIEHGDYIVFHEEGGIMITGQYLEGKKVGQWKFYNEEGEIVLDTLFRK
jgi:antitoxin component YwqK of YwqJK toxin-antitoxin module